MKFLLSHIFLLWVIFISIETSAIEQKVFEVDPNRELTVRESIVPTFYQEYGPYLFFVGQPAYDPQCCSVLRAYSRNSLWRLDSRNNSVQLVLSDIEESIYEKANPYAIINDRIIYFSTEGLISADLGGLDKKLLGSLRSGRLDISGNQMISYNGYVYFPVAEPSGEHSLWRSNGTIEGTSKVALCVEDMCYETPRKMIVSGNKLFLIVTSGGNTGAIWTINSENDVTIFLDASVSAFENMFPASNGILFNSLSQLWFTDGTSSGSYPVNFLKKGIPSMARESIHFGDLVVVASEEIYVITEKGKGVNTLIDIDPRVENGNEYNSFPSNLTVLNGAVYFIGKFYDPALQEYTFKLMSIDGTPDGIHQIYEFDRLKNDEYKIIGTKGNKLILFRHSFSNGLSINEVWVSDGTMEGTIKLTDYGVPNSLWEFSAWHFFNDDFYFSGFTKEQGIELWRTDSSVAGTLIAKDIGYGQTKVQKGPMASDGIDIFYMMQRKWYGIVEGIQGEHTERELWRTNALTMRSAKVTQWIYPKRTLAQIITVEGGQYWWIQSEMQSNFYDLVFYDYQAGSITTVITEMQEQCVGYNLKSRKMAVLGKKYFFQAPVVDNDSWSCQLWVSDGTSDGTKPITTFPETAIFREILDNIVIYQNEVYFNLIVQHDEYLPLRAVIFKSDGTITGTGEAFRLIENGEANTAYIENIVATSKGLFLVTYSDVANLWFWQTSSVNKIIENANNFSIWSLAQFKQGISFIFDNSIWVSNGTDDGTYPMIELQAVDNNEWGTRRLHSTPNFEQLIYGAYDEKENYRLWITDGSLYGTKTIGPILQNEYVIINAFVGDDLYLTSYSGNYNEDKYENLMRYSLVENQFELLIKRSVINTNYPSTIVEAQGRIFIGQESESISYYGPGLGGPFVTAKLNNDDFDNDGVSDSEDMFPLHIDEQLDTDKDNIGNNFDSDDDNDGIEDTLDLYPLNASEWADNDNDGIGDIADIDDDNDGVSDWLDSYPRDASRSDNNSVDNSNNSTSENDNADLKNQSSSHGGVINIYMMILGVLLIRIRQSIS